MRGSRAAEGDRDRPGSARSARSAGFILALPRGGRLASPSPRPRASLTDLTVPHALQLLVTSPVSPIGQCLAPRPVPRGCPASVFGRHG